ncbi:unnamed protein product [Rhizoctonia solani]|uniref:Uncharacterized protein n=1 Tax=Rhizoctonia solani TaxID=456999 RepID=A0A8H3D3R6_9AGAM|nr:unnamed protein product [Rhizoctonia solani]
MLCTHLGIRSRSIATDLLSHCLYPRGYHSSLYVYSIGRVMSKQFPPDSRALSPYSSKASYKPRGPKSFIELVGFIKSVGKAQKIVAKRGSAKLEPDKTKKKDLKKKTRDENHKFDEQRKDHPKEGNEHIVAALVEAINKDYWPDIIYYSTLHPEHLSSDHQESWTQYVTAKRLDQVDHIPGIDYDEELLANDIPWPTGPNKPKEPWTFELNDVTLTMKSKKNESDGSNKDDPEKPGLACT